MYVLEKISIDAGKDSMISTGHKTQGNALSTFLSGEIKPTPVEGLESIKVGVQVLLTRGFNYHNTSPIKEIIERGEDYVMFHTNTSVYKLSKVEGE